MKTAVHADNQNKKEQEYTENEKGRYARDLSYESALRKLILQKV